QSSTLITLQSDYKGVSIRPSPRGHRSRVVNTRDAPRAPSQRGGGHRVDESHRWSIAEARATWTVLLSGKAR
ncbi:hypothetical protein AB0B96_40460, partial [Streptosporangium sp. NPDC049046]